MEQLKTNRIIVVDISNYIKENTMKKQVIIKKDKLLSYTTIYDNFCFDKEDDSSSEEVSSR